MGRKSRKEFKENLKTIYGDKKLSDATIENLKKVWKEHPEFITNKAKEVLKPRTSKIELKLEGLASKAKWEPVQMKKLKADHADLRNIKSFKEAFAAADKAGLKTFDWGKSTYTTEKDEKWKERWGKKNVSENKSKESSEKTSKPTPKSSSKGTPTPKLSPSKEEKKSTPNTKTPISRKKESPSLKVENNLSSIPKIKYTPTVEIGDIVMGNPHVFYYGKDKLQARVYSNRLNEDGDIEYSDQLFTKNPAGTEWEIIPRTSVSYDGGTPIQAVRDRKPAISNNDFNAEALLKSTIATPSNYFGRFVTGKNNDNAIATELYYGKNGDDGTNELYSNGILSRSPEGRWWYPPNPISGDYLEWGKPMVDRINQLMSSKNKK